MRGHKRQETCARSRASPGNCRRYAKMQIGFRFLFSAVLSAHAALVGLAHAEGDIASIPEHLALARELAANVKPEDNDYRLGSQAISFPTDFLANKYSVHADCSGFLLALFDRARYSTQSQMSMVPSFPPRRRPAAEDFVLSIENEKGFKRIWRVADIRPGDVLAHAMLNLSDQHQMGTTGHVMLVDSAPKLIEPRDPIIRDTRQFELTIIDVNVEYLGADDSRILDSSKKVKGIGRGTLRIYADSDGRLVGFARSFQNGNKFVSYDPRFPSDTKPRKAAVGRPITGG